MPDFLPQQYAFSHDYAMFLNDILSDFVKTGEANDVFTTSFELKQEEHAEELDKLPNDQKWAWCEANGYGDISKEVIFKNVIVALLADFCHFVFEALSCSAKGKLTVTYSLLRKPFKDNLL